MTDQDPAGPPDPADPADDLFANHPDLASPEWARRAERIERKEAARYRRAVQAKAASARAARKPSAKAKRPERPVLLNPTSRTSQFLVIVVVLGTALLAWHPWSHGGSPSPLAQQLVEPTVTGTARRSAPVNLAQPFANTPAAGWSDGAAGIVVPPAVAVGSVPAATVGLAMARVKQVLVAAHLDDRMLVQHDTSAYLALFATTARAQASAQLTPAHPDGNGELTLLANGFHLLPAPVKVNGTMSTSLDPTGELVVHTNYVFAYPFAPSDPDSITEYWQFIPVLHVAEDFILVSDRRQPAADQGLWLTHSQSYGFGVGCTRFDQGYLAPAFSEPRLDGPTGANPDSYFDPRHPLNVPNTCH
jgi:hypothetical protein